MNGFKDRWCKRCKKKTEHRIYKETEGHQRVVEGLISLGMSEIFNRDRKQCMCCGYRSKV